MKNYMFYVKWLQLALKAVRRLWRAITEHQALTAAQISWQGTAYVWPFWAGTHFLPLLFPLHSLRLSYLFSCPFSFDCGWGSQSGASPDSTYTDLNTAYLSALFPHFPTETEVAHIGLLLFGTPPATGEEGGTVWLRGKVRVC